MRATEHFGLNTADAGTYPVKPDGAGADYLFGGRYELKVLGADADGPTVDLQQLGPDGATYVSIPAAPISAAGTTLYDLPPGRYQIVTSADGASVSLTRVPVSE